MNLTKHFVTGTAIFYSVAAFGISLPVSEDTFSTAAGILVPSNGKATSLSIKTNQVALLNFDRASLADAYNATNVVRATLKIYVSRAVTPGDLQVFSITSPWSESSTTNTPIPDSGPTPISTVPSAKISDKRFLTIDVTSEVIGTLSGTNTNFGFLLRDSIGQIRIPSKEGPTLGPSAQLEIDANLALDAAGSGSFPGSLSVGSNLNLIGLLRQGSETSSAVSSGGRGLVMRRVESTNSAIGTVVARTDTLTLERDGTPRGWRIVNTANVGFATVSAIFLGVDSRQTWKTIALPNPGTAGTNVLFSAGDLPTPLLNLRCTFGNTYEPGHQTEVSLSTSDSDSATWVGTVISTFNQ